MILNCPILMMEGMDDVSVLPYEYAFDGVDPVSHFVISQNGSEVVINLDDFGDFLRMLTNFGADVKTFNAALGES